MASGKLIALEGTDGSGKGTQLKLLVEYLVKQGIPHETLDFPRYGKFFGDLAGRMLKGELGPVETIPAQLAVLPFACDRWQVRDELKGWLNEGKLVISNRYTASSAVYHAAKLPADQQMAFIDWVYKLENEIIGLPKEDLVIYFHVPVAVAQHLIDKRAAETPKEKDEYEKDPSMLFTVERLYGELAKQRGNWNMIECTRDGMMLKPVEIQKLVLDELTQNGVL
ncbi:hypothetical protein A3A64_03575 [Candidatus Gottesmanbacteria bacterium RIFCSPLOWO2_01_FULL_48_11]|uniref:Thymidylate kinase n=3 Tax=Patescibacteria group TaxID=1783273 RepID=A0A0G1TWF8_9BACT|nr:MAG: Thymidylate kinase [Candidatus Nomurabacteria bacterium GW2011_GWB1_47_6]KKU86151.1 MAG: Thymidylate kinase [Candidatus Gottesmanbacteria bacterium GW2011_GWA2_47_9]OGG28395.1 MAG: hypothetical protein A3A64_03575 [Candidatus Gottesmanbacteria bacterium RIFCSPLOWO2_01_FULL_48_11]